MKLWQAIPVLMLVVAANARAQNPTPPTPPTPPAPPAAPAAAAPAAPAVDPSGAYEFTTVANGGTVTGTLYITPVATGGYSGRIVTNAFPEIPVTGASAAGKAVDVKAAMPDGELAIHFVLDGADFKGNWTMGSDSGDFNGKKLPPAPPTPPKQ